MLDFFTNTSKQDKSYQSISDILYPFDTLFILETPPVKSLAYPLLVGDEWVYRAESILGKINRKVITKLPITTGAGNFYCYKIKTIYEAPYYNEMIDYYDYISVQGLIQRSITIKNVSFTDNQGNIIGTGDIIEEIKLYDYFVK